MDWHSRAHSATLRKSHWGVVAILLASLALVAGTAAAATVLDEETYHLREGEVVADDLVVFAQDVIIDGTVQGDLVAFGQFIAVNGVVEQDVIAAGAEVQVNGVVQDNVRAAGAAVRINGRVGDDLFMAGGGFFAPGFGAITIPMGERSVVSGISTGGEAAIGGDAYITGGLATLQGLFRGDLFAAVAELIFDATVEATPTCRAAASPLAKAHTWRATCNTRRKPSRGARMQGASSPRRSRPPPRPRPRCRPGETAHPSPASAGG